MIRDFTIASVRENNLFMQKYCRNEKARLSITKYFKVDVEGYEDLAPGQQIYGWLSGGKLIGDTVISFKVKDLREMKLYYPVFPEVVGKRLLITWDLPQPPKWSVYVENNKWAYGSEVNRLNKEMRSLLIYSRLFISLQQRVFSPMPYSFKEVYYQLNQFPNAAVDSSVVNMVNRVVSHTLKIQMNVLSYANLQDFIVYFQNRYKFLSLLDGDFSGLRKLLKQGEDTFIFKD